MTGRAAAAVLLLAGTTVAHAAPVRDQVYAVSALDGAVIGVSTLIAVVPPLLEDRLVSLRCPCDRSEVPRFERFAIGRNSRTAARASDVTLWLSLAVPPIANLAALGPSEAWLQDATVFTEALTVSSALVTAVKFAVQRPTPRVYAGDPRYLRDRDAYRAFYSGHATQVAAALTTAAWTIRLRYGEQVWPWIVVGAAGTSVAVERVLAGRHFPSDVVVGAAVGAAVGTLVPLLHERRERGGGSRVGLVPSPTMLLLSGSF